MTEQTGTAGTEPNFAENVRFYREKMGWSQTEFANRLQRAGLENFHQTTVSRLEKGERPIRLGEARVIAAVLGQPVSDLWASPVESALGALANDMNATGAELGRLADAMKAHRRRMRAIKEDETDRDLVARLDEAEKAVHRMEIDVHKAASLGLIIPFGVLEVNEWAVRSGEPPEGRERTKETDDGEHPETS